MCAPSKSPRKSSQATLDRVRAWSLANPERRRKIQRDYYLRTVGGSLKPVLTNQERFDSLYTPEPSTGCWLWTGAINRNGYGKTKVDRKDITAHRWSWILHRGAIPEGMHVLHRCDVPGCVNPAHLWIGSNLDNDKDKRQKGRHFVQPIHREAKVTEGDVLEMRRLRGIETVVALGKRFGLHHSQVSRIQRGLQWPHIPLGE
jgi:hypothetical protein